MKPALRHSVFVSMNIHYIILMTKYIAFIAHHMCREVVCLYPILCTNHRRIHQSQNQSLSQSKPQSIKQCIVSTLFITWHKMKYRPLLRMTFGTIMTCVWEMKASWFKKERNGGEGNRECLIYVYLWNEKRKCMSDCRHSKYVLWSGWDIDMKLDEILKISNLWIGCAKKNWVFGKWNSEFWNDNKWWWPHCQCAAIENIEIVRKSAGADDFGKKI